MPVKKNPVIVVNFISYKLLPIKINVVVKIPVKVNYENRLFFLISFNFFILKPCI